MGARGGEHGRRSGLARSLAFLVFFFWLVLEREMVWKSEWWVVVVVVVLSLRIDKKK